MPSRALLVVLTVGLLLLSGLPAPAHADAPVPAPVVMRALAAPTAAPGARTARVRAPIAFSMVGFRLPRGAHLRLRTSGDGERWSGWTEIEPLPLDEGPDLGAGRAESASAATPPVWTGAARWLEFDVEGAGLGQVRPVVLDVVGLERSLPARAWDAIRAALRPPPAAALVQPPGIVTRAGWGADESLRKGQPSVARRVRAAVVHHTVNANTYTAAEAPAIIRGIYRYHTGSLGWSDIGYNLLVDRFGTVYEGRAGGVERGVIGAHAGGFNTGTFGVASIGTHSDSGPSPAAAEAVARTIAWKFDLHHIDVTGTVELRSAGSTRYPEGQVVRLPTLMGHRAVSTTSCPGNALDGLLPALRHRVLELGGAMILDHEAAPLQVTVAAGRALDGPVRFTARLRPAGDWVLEVTDPRRVVVHRATGSGQAITSTWSPAPGSVPGRYDWRLTAPGRRDATEYVELVPPSIRDVTVTPTIGRGGQTGPFSTPLRFRAALWPQAAWRLVVRAPDGTIAHAATGIGETVDTAWAGRQGLAPGGYAWTLEADDAQPVGAVVEVLWPVLSRAGVASDGIGGAVVLSGAAFPAEGSARHAVLARVDLFADAMTGGPLAGPDGPILLTARDRLDPRVRGELERVLPAGRSVYLLGGPGALAPAVAEALRDRWRVVRLAGPGRAETAVAVAEEVLRLRGPSERVLVARAGPDSAVPWADALAGGAYGAAHGVPVLLTDSGALSPAVADFVARHGVRDSVALGGPAALSDTVLRALPGPRRVFGLDRTGTAAAVAESLWGRTAGAQGDRLLVGNGYAADAWALALAASPLAARQQAPLLLVGRDDVPPGTRDHLTRLGYAAPRHATGWLLGGEGAVGAAAADAVMRLLQ